MEIYMFDIMYIYSIYIYMYTNHQPYPIMPFANLPPGDNPLTYGDRHFPRRLFHPAGHPLCRFLPAEGGRKLTLYPNAVPLYSNMDGK